jgi:hypothetical protein
MSGVLTGAAAPTGAERVMEAVFWRAGSDSRAGTLLRFPPRAIGFATASPPRPLSCNDSAQRLASTTGRRRAE